MADRMAAASRRPRVVVVGSGFAGAAAAREAARGPVDVLVVDRNNFQTFQPLLYQVATAGLNPADVGYPVRGLFRRYRNISFRRATVSGVDWAGKVLECDGSEPIRFDYLILAAGATTNYFGVKGAERHSFPLYGLADAMRLRNHILTRFEHAEANPSLVDEGALTFVVVGGGPTGVEMAGALVEVLESIVRKDYRRIEPGRARIVLLEMLDSVLPPFSETSQRHAYEALRSRGVEIRLGETVEAITGTSVRLASGDRINSTTVIWAAGVQASPLAHQLGLELGKAGRILVHPDLSVPAHRNVFVAGDLAAAKGPDGRLYPQLAAVAVQQGEHAGRHVLRRIAGSWTAPFVYKDKGVMATVGRRSAVAELPSGLKLTGTVGWFAWLFLHLIYLTGLRNRLSVLLNWAYNYVARERGARLILEADGKTRAANRGNTGHEERRDAAS